MYLLVVFVGARAAPSDTALEEAELLVREAEAECRIIEALLPSHSEAWKRPRSAQSEGEASQRLPRW